MNPYIYNLDNSKFIILWQDYYLKDNQYKDDKTFNMIKGNIIFNNNPSEKELLISSYVYAFDVTINIASLNDENLFVIGIGGCYQEGSNSRYEK